MKPEAVREMLRKERLERDVLTRLKWDPRLSKLEHEFSVLYLEDDELKESRCSELKLRGDFFSCGGKLVPLHRIRKFLYRGEVVWVRRACRE